MKELVEDCPCKVDCPRHGDCVACIRFHRQKGWPLVACMKELLRAHKAKKIRYSRKDDCFGSRLFLIARWCQCPFPEGQAL